MADVATDVELGEVLLILGAVGAAGILLYKLFSSDTAKAAGDQTKLLLQGKACTAKEGPVPGIIGASKQQVCAANVAATNLASGGSVIWSCGSDYDYAQACGNVVQVRHNFWSYLNPWADPVTYKTVPRDSYVRPTGGTVNPQFACCYNVETPCCVTCAGF